MNEGEALKEVVVNAPPKILKRIVVRDDFVSFLSDRLSSVIHWASRPNILVATFASCDQPVLDDGVITVYKPGENWPPSKCARIHINDIPNRIHNNRHVA